MKHLVVAFVLLTLVACRDSSADSPLERALRSPNRQDVRKLFEQPVDIDRPMSDGQSPLLLAVSKRNDEGVRLLLERGADFTVKDAKGRDLFEILWGQGNPGHQESDCLGLLIEAGFPVPKHIDEKGQTWFHRLAARCDDARIAPALVKQGFDLEGKDKAGWTPLHHAVLHSRSRFCKGLIEAGADVNAETEKELSQVVPESEGPDEIVFLYMARSRPLDLENQPGTRRGSKEFTIEELLTQRGATRNLAVKNQF